MRARLETPIGWVIAPLLIGPIVPSLVILYLELWVARHPLGTALVNTATMQWGDNGSGLLLIIGLGMIPFIALAAIAAAAGRRMHRTRVACLTIGGLLGIVVLMAWGHYAVWAPLYGIGELSSTASIAFLFIPFLALGSMLLGVLAGWLVSRLPLWRPGAVPR